MSSTPISRSSTPSPFVGVTPYSYQDKTNLYIEVHFKAEEDLKAFASLVNGVANDCFKSISALKGLVTLPSSNLRPLLSTILTVYPPLEKRLCQAMESMKTCRATA